MAISRSFGRLAIGVTLGVGLTIAATQAWQVTAAPGDSDTTFVPVSPCRLFDMRPGTAPTDGKKTPLGPGVANVHTQQVTGNVGSCVGIPSDATAVALNVTAANPTAPSFLTVYPADQPLPNASSLNWTSGQAATPNAVDVKLSADGKINLYTESGTVSVIADVVGYYTPKSLSEINARLTAAEGQLALLGARQPVVEYTAAIDEVDLLKSDVDPVTLVVDDAQEMLTVTIDAPTAGKVALVAHATAKSGSLEGRLVCQITDDTAAVTIDGMEVLGIASPATGGAQPSLGTNRVYDVVAGPNTFDLMCAATGGLITIHYRSMSATFTPS
jgi:hypothetical protein